MHHIKDNQLLRGQKITKFLLYEKPRKKLVEWTTDHDIYKGYRFKKRHITTNQEGKNIVHAPYISTKDSTDSEFSLTFPEWKNITQMYWDIVVDEMIEGHQFELPRNLGTIQLYKKRKNNVRKDKLYRNSHTMGYIPFVIWHRYKHGSFLHKMWYIFNISRKKQWSRISKRIFENPSLMFRYPETTI